MINVQMGCEMSFCGDEEDCQPRSQGQTLGTRLDDSMLETRHLLLMGPFEGSLIIMANFLYETGL